MNGPGAILLDRVGRLMRRFLPFLLCWVVTALDHLSAQQPFLTDDAGVAAPGRVHFESFDEYDWLAAQQLPHLRQNTINAKLNFGVANGIEADVDAPLITIDNGATYSVRENLSWRWAWWLAATRQATFTAYSWAFRGTSDRSRPVRAPSPVARDAESFSSRGEF